jgi:hypothetical protein
MTREKKFFFLKKVFFIVAALSITFFSLQGADIELYVRGLRCWAI